PGGAVEEARLEVCLEVRNLPRDCGCRQAKPLGGPGKAAGLDDPGKRLDSAKAVHTKDYCNMCNRLSTERLFIPAGRPVKLMAIHSPDRRNSMKLYYAAGACSQAP